ncbi:MAG: hypothetical protein F6J87_00790 [Spirulina sp. SIO3F2]|nr:hypothetical protein [Spirulina sp. SIO3F2]
MTRLSLEQLLAGSRYDSASAELLEQLLTSESVYPAPQTVADEAWTEIETALPATVWSDAEVQTGSDRLFETLNNCWPAQSETNSSSLVSQLQDQFGTTVPADWLQTISDRATQLAQSTTSPLEQLLDCVGPLLSDWSLDDLQVFARPVAFAMRSAPAALPKEQNWSALSPVEQARYTLQVAKYALEAAQEQESGS